MSTQIKCDTPGCERPMKCRGLCTLHYQRMRREELGVPKRDTRPLSERFWDRVDLMVDGCWTWTGARGDHGYGSARARGTTYLMHRFVYELLVGPIPDGLVIDHLCRNRACVRPDHLEPVTNRENTMRGAVPGVLSMQNPTCKHGHPRTPENTYVRADTGNRFCRVCATDSARRSNRATAAARRARQGVAA